MEKHSVDAIVGALNMANVRYLVAGGLAVVAHGYVRFTADVDLIIDLEPGNVMRAVASLERLGYRPRAPVAFGGSPIRRSARNGCARRTWRPQDLLDLEKLKSLDTEARDE